MNQVKLDLYEGQILPWQVRARDDTHRFKVFVAGRKARKTTFIVNRLAKAAMTDTRQLTYPYIAPFRKQAKEIVWEDHLGRIKRLAQQFGIRSKINESDLSIRFEGYGKLQVTGADNAEALRGKSDWGGVGCDEYASWRPYVWQEIIRPNLQVHKAWGLIGGTPKGYGNDLYKMAKLGDHNNVIDDKKATNDPEFMTFHATSYDNIYIDKGEIEAAKRQSTVDFFNQEYLALFTRFTGLVYPEFEFNTHVEPVEHIYNEHADYLFGQDFAVRGFNALVPGYVKSNGHFYIPADAEYKESNLTAVEHAQPMRDKLEKIASLDKFVGYGDPAGFNKNQQGVRNGKDMAWSLADEYIEEGFPIVPANNEVTAGINYVKQMFKNNKIHIDPSNTKLIEELMQYQWKEQSEKRVDIESEPEQVRKINDHLADSLRYVLYSKPQTPDEEESSRSTIFPAVFPMKLEEPVESDDHFEEMEASSIYD